MADAAEMMKNRMAQAPGFIAALDQSGGSTPKALRLYGVEDSEYSNDTEMFDLMHAMRVRIMTDPAFTRQHILAAILFEQTMDRDVEGVQTPTYLWREKGIVPFLKVDKGLADEQLGVQLMKSIEGLDDLLERAASLGVFGTKMRSVIKNADRDGITAIADQQFAFGHRILNHGLIPILEPEVDIHSPTKAEAEVILKDRLLNHLNRLGGEATVMLKLSLPSVDGFYTELIEHPRVLRVVALSGGYSRTEANAILARQPGLIASFSRALTEGLSAQQSDGEFSATLSEAIASIYAASVT